MTERFRLSVDVSDMRICLRCPISKQRFENKTLDSRTIYDGGTETCIIAELEQELGHIPTFKEIQNNLHIAGSEYWFNIPPKCPNKYLNPDNIPVSNRR